MVMEGEDKREENKNEEVKKGSCTVCDLYPSPSIAKRKKPFAVAFVRLPGSLILGRSDARTLGGQRMGCRRRMREGEGMKEAQRHKEREREREKEQQGIKTTHRINVTPSNFTRDFLPHTNFALTLLHSGHAAASHSSSRYFHPHPHHPHPLPPSLSSPPLKSPLPHESTALPPRPATEAPAASLPQ